MTVRTRFSPSPTGMIHLGNARAALFSNLFAKKNHGVFILRIEDTDATRSLERYIHALQYDLRWLGLNWQEGPMVDGPLGPYFQSARQAIYETYYQVLNEKQQIYPCFCTDQALAMERKLQLSRGEAPRYRGKCSKLSASEINALLAQGLKPAYRFRVPCDKHIEFIDLVKGPQSFASNDIGDFIIRRADGSAPFLFCNVIDDATMQVSHVLRGEDHLANTPRQMMLLQMLHLPIPQYGHLSLIVGDDGAPLSKRHGSYSIHELRAEGYLPQALLNYLARLGHTHEVQTLLSIDELAQHFHLERLSRSPARFDVIQLRYWQKLAVQTLDVHAMWQWLGDEMKQHIPTAEQTLFIQTVQANVSFPEEAMEWAKIFFNDQLNIDTSKLTWISEAGESFFKTAAQAFDRYDLDLSAVFHTLKENLHVSGKQLFMPLRVALTGKTSGPELIAIVKLLGIKKIKARLQQAITLIKEQGSV